MHGMPGYCYIFHISDIEVIATSEVQTFRETVFNSLHLQQALYKETYFGMLNLLVDLK